MSGWKQGAIQKQVLFGILDSAQSPDIKPHDTLKQTFSNDVKAFQLS
jgi:hypothetical protein